MFCRQMATFRPIYVQDLSAQLSPFLKKKTVEIMNYKFRYETLFSLSYTNMALHSPVESHSAVQAVK